MQLRRVSRNEKYVKIWPGARTKLSTGEEKLVALQSQLCESHTPSESPESVLCAFLSEEDADVEAVAVDATE